MGCAQAASSWTSRAGQESSAHKSVHEGSVPAHDPQPTFADAVDRHIEEHFEPIEFVNYEIASHLVGVHSHVVAPTEERPQ